ncbi:MAG TPA: hypothetical protein DIU20_06820 [Cryomorphaceae bacterium]|nr:hypothetical protein [Cryomorphaceae bacterium]
MIGRFKKLLRTNKSLSLISSGTAAILGLITFGLLARSFSMSELGYWGFFMTVYTLFDMLRAGLISNALIKRINECDTEEDAAVVIGSGWKLSLLITIIGSAAIALTFYIIYYFTQDESYRYLFQWFVPIALLSLPHSMAVWILNAYVRFDRIVWIRFFLQGSLLLGVVYQFYLQPGLNFILICYLLSNLLPALLVMVTGWSKLRYFHRGNRDMDRSLLNFGKFSMASMVGSNFLRSSDTFIIMSILGPGANAVYSVAERLIGLFDIPLRAFVAIAFPQLAKKYAVGWKQEFEHDLEKDSGFSTLLLLPISILVFIFAEPLVIALGGEEYQSSADVLRMFAIYTALTPLDRFTGIALDVINRPDLNFYKVVLMLSANVVGVILVLQFSEKLVWVAFISIITFGTGILFGFLFLRQHISIHLRNVVQKGGYEFVRLVKKYVGNSN